MQFRPTRNGIKMASRPNKDHLIVVKEGRCMLDATIRITHVPADAVGPAHKKYSYELSDGTAISYGWTKTEALHKLLQVAKERGWRVLQYLT